MTTESKVVCELVDSLLSQPTLLEAITKNLDAPRNLPANTNSNDALSSTSIRNECSESVSISNYNTRFRNRAQDEEDEVRHMFSRGRSSTQLEPCNPAANSNQCSPRPDLNSAMHFPMYHFTRNFGRQKYQRAQKPKYNKRLFRGPSMFMKEIILLPGPHDQIVVKQGTKQFLYESGHIITTFEFDKMWTSNEVQEHLHRAFSPKLDNVDIQLLMPCHNKLVKPLLMNEQTLSGLLISKIVKQKSVYLLPSKQILEVPEKSLQKELSLITKHGHLIVEKTKSIRNDDYYLAGQAMAVSLVHGGPAPSFFSPHLYSCLISDTKSVHPRLEDVPDPETQEMLREIEHAISLEMLQATIQKHSTILSVAGCLRGVKSLGEKYELSQDFIHWYLVGRMMPSLERFKDGLRQLGVLQAMEIHKQIFEEAFVWIKKIITADTVDAIFEVSFSPAGSNSRTLEKKVVGYWRDYLQDCEELVCEAKLQDILCFVTGADVIPPLG